MRCNIFKPISNDTGEFLMFSQYTDDLTKEDPAKGSYRVVPSRFAALELNVGTCTDGTVSGGFTDFINASEEGAPATSNTALNKYLSQYLQSYYENSVCLVKDILGYDEKNKEMYWDRDAIENDSDGYATALLWNALEKWNLIHYDGEKDAFPELKFIGDINIHSDRHADGMNYNDIYCYISPSDSEKYYGLKEIKKFPGKNGNMNSFPLSSGGDPSDPGYYDYSKTIMGWTQAAYPINNGGIDCKPRSDGGSYNLTEVPSGGKYPEITDVRNREEQDSNKYFTFNCIILFYDVYDDLDAEEPTRIHYNRPLGIYFTGPVQIFPDEENVDTTLAEGFRNQVTKYVSHEDIFGQGTGWSVRLMTRVVATPNASSYAITVDGGDDYETVAGAMGVIANAIADIRTDMKLQSENYQLMKDHLAIFKNTRTNVPYVKSVLVPGEENAVEFWFVNGRNTGQRVYPVEES